MWERSGERKEQPDIDVDFEHVRREEIIQWILKTYGRERSALTAVVTRYRSRGAVREVGKALGLPEDMTASLAGLAWPLAGRALGLRMARGLSNVHAATIVGAHGDGAFAGIDEVWRRSGVPRAAIEKLADADAFQGLAHDRRQALWKVRGLGDAPLPLLAAADALEGVAAGEGLEPTVTLRPRTEGREVVEDYRSIRLWFRAHPLSFLREELKQRGIVTAADLDRIKDGRRVEVAGVILVRQKPDSAKVILFMIIEDETGVANGIL